MTTYPGGVPSPLPETLIKGSAKRSVFRQGHDRVVKRFHAGGPLGRIRDGWRALREQRALLALRAAGLRAPLPLGIRATGRGWELAMENVPGGCPLDEVLSAGQLSRGQLGRLGSELGHQLAALEAAALIHPDLHAGNVLIDGENQPWLVDPARLRRGAPVQDAGRIESHLIGLTAHVREVSEPAFRRRFLDAYLGALPPARLAAFAASDPTELAPRIERAARLRRREHVQGRLPRWMRRSGATKPFHAGSARGIQVRVPEPEGSRLLRRKASSLGAAETEWLRAARLVEHGLPGWAPARLHFAPQPAVEYWVPTSAEPPAGVPNPRRLGELLGALHDRGLAPGKLRRGDLLVRADGRLLLGPIELVDTDPESIDAETPPWIQPDLWDWNCLPRTARRACQAGFARAHRAGSADRLELRRGMPDA